MGYNPQWSNTPFTGKKKTSTLSIATLKCFTLGLLTLKVFNLTFHKHRCRLEWTVWATWTPQKWPKHHETLGVFKIKNNGYTTYTHINYVFEAFIEWNWNMEPSKSNLWILMDFFDKWTRLWLDSSQSSCPSASLWIHRFVGGKVGPKKLPIHLGSPSIINGFIMRSEKMYDPGNRFSSQEVWFDLIRDKQQTPNGAHHLNPLGL